MTNLAHDLRIAARALGRRPGFTAAAILTLAIAIAANTAIFSVASAVLRHPLPFPDADRLVLLWGQKPREGPALLPFSMPDFLDVQAQSKSLDSLSGVIISRATVAGTPPELVQTAIVSANLFSTLGVRPALGRTFRPAEDQPGTAPVVVLSHTLWMRRFGGDANALGRSVSLDGRAYEVVGVLPAGFALFSFPNLTEAWLPLGLDRIADRRVARGLHSMMLVGRLLPGTSPAAAQKELDTIARGIEAANPADNTGRNIVTVVLKDQIVRNFRTAVLVLVGAGSFVLLIACANIANLLLVRAHGRRREFGVRVALGAGSWSLIRQVLAEHLLLAMAGGSLGLLAGWWGLTFLPQFPLGKPDLATPYQISGDRIAVDGFVFVLTVAASMGAGLLFGLLPAIQASRTDVARSLKEGKGSTTAGRGHGMMRESLVVSEIALAVMLAIGAGLLIRTVVNLHQIDPGFEPDNVMSLDIALPAAKYRSGAQVRAFYDDVLARVRSVHGVAAAGAVEFLPLKGGDSATGAFVDGRPGPRPGDDIAAHYRTATPDYFRAMGIRITRGRSFSDADRADAPRVTIINEAMARKFWPGEDPIGKRVALVIEALRFKPDGPPVMDPPSAMREVVGVVADVRHTDLQADASPEMYIPFAQHPIRDLTVVVRTSIPSAAIAGELRRVILAIDADQPVANVRSLSDLVSASIGRPRFNAQLLSLFAALALMLAAIGVYGVMSFSVTERSREIAIRAAVGSQPGEIVALIVSRGLKLALVGGAIGLAGGFALSRGLAGLLVGVRPTDAVTFLLAASVLVSVAMLASYLPARRAAAIDPMEALRTE